MRSLYGMPGLERLADNVQDDEDAPRLLEDLQEAIVHYQVCLQLVTFLDIDKDTGSATNGGQ